MRCEPLERRVLLTAIPASVETATLDVLAAIRDDVRSAIAGHVVLQTQLPVIGASIADDLDLQTILSTGLYDPINTYFGGAPTDTGLQAALEAISVTSGDITVNVNSASVTIDNSDISNPLLLINFTLIGTQETEETASYPAGTITIDDSTVTVLHTLNLPVNIQIPFTSGVIADEDVFTNLQAAQVTSSVTAYTGATGNIGLLDITISPANFSLAVDLDIQFNDTDGAGNLTLTQLQAGNIADDMTITPIASSMSLNLGVQATLCGEMLGASPELSLSTTNVFSGSALTWALNSDLSPVSIFQNMSVADVQGLFNQLITTLNGLADTLNLDDIPWIEESLSDLVDLGSTLSQYTSQLQDLSGYTFDSFQELVEQLAAYISIPVVDLNLRCDDTGNSVLIDLELQKSFSQPILLDMSEDAGPLSIKAGVQADFTADLTINATVGFDLDPLGGGEALSDRFFITEGSSIVVDADLDMPDMDVGVAIGPVGVCITDGTAHFSIGTSISMVDPGTNAADSRVDLGEMIDNPIGDYVTIDSPTVTVTGELPLDGCTSAMNTLLGIDTTSSATRPALTLSLGTLNDITTFTITPDAEFNALIDGLTDFSDVSIWDAVGQIVLFLQNSNIEAFNVKLPLINKSINELVDAADSFLSLTGGLNTNFGSLKTAINAQLAGLDAAISTAVTDLAISIVDPGDLAIAQARLLDLRDALDVALAQADLSGLAIDMMSILGGLDSFITDYTADISTAALSTAISAIEGLIPSLNSLETRLETMLGLAPADLSLTMENFGADRAVVIRLNLTDGFHSTIPLDFSFEGQTVPVTVDGSGDLTVDADITLQLDFGFNLSTLTPFLLDTSNITGTADVSTTNLSVLAMLGAVTGVGLGLPGDFGTVSLKEKETASFTGDGSTTNFIVALTADQRDLAIVTVNGVVQDEDDFTLTTIQLTFDAAPASSAAILVYYPGAGAASIGITLNDNSGSTSDGVITFSDINLSTFDFNIDGLINARVSVDLPFFGDAGDLRFFMDLSDFDSLYAALPDDLETNMALGEDCDFSIFLSAFGDLLDTLENGLELDILQNLPLIGDGIDVAAGVVGDLRDLVATLQAALEGGEAAIQSFFFTNLGSILVDGNGDPVDDPSDIDVTIAGTTCVEVNLHLVGTDTFTANFDVGLDALVLEFAASGAVDIDMGYDIELGLGFSLTQGFYIVSNSDPDDPEVEFNLDVDLAQGSSLDADLFFLHLSATEVNDPGTILSGSLNLNLIDPSGSDNHVTINDILTTDFTDLLEVSLDGTATVDLLLEADVGSDPNLPYISAVLSVEWDFLGNDGLTGQEPIVSIHDVSLHFGDFLSKLIGPVVDQLDDWIEPIKPILDFLNTEIPVISDVSQFLGGAPVTVISLISGALGEGGDTVQKTFDILNAIVGIVSATSGFGDDIAINFGDFNFSQDLRTPGSVNADTSGTLDESGDGSAEDQLDDEAAGNAGLAGILDDLQEIGLDIPIITSPLNIIKLLLGQRVDLITWDIPRLEAGFEFEQSFGPLLPPVPLYARIFGSLSVFADFFIGLDTRGFEPGHTVFDGFYFGDFDGDGNEMPELGLNATIGAGAELNVVIAKAGVEGGVSADLGADWNDLDDDGKVYFDELGIQLGRGLKCVFDLSGQLSAFLNFYASLGLSTPFGDITLWDKTINLLNITLFDFSYTCPPLPPPILAHVSDGTDGFAPNTLVGHIGPFASLRQPGATDGKDKITITALLDEGTGLPIPNAYLVSGFGEEQPYYGVTSIYFDGGAEADDIRADATVTVPITLFGGDGDDKLDGGSGPDSISGGDGIDWIYGFDGADILNGDDGNDVVFGGLGNDTSISGGDGDDQLYGEEGNDTMYGGDGSDIMYGDAQPDNNGNSTGSGNDVMDGDDGDDVMNGAGGNDDMDGGDGADFIEGIDGNDTAHGGDGNDVINGDLGNDVLYGGDDDDVIRGFNDETQPGGADDDEIYGDEGFDDLAGNNGNDFIVGGTQSDAILGGLGNDTILSGWGDDVIHGDDGLDYIEGGPDNDDICGQGQTDTIWGGTTVYGFPYILLGYVDPFTDGGFVQTSCTSPIIFIPPTEIPHDGTTTISGQKYHDLNANGVHDPNEPGLDRWTITLYDATGGIVASQLTYSSDLNSDGSIDPYSEMGLYEFAGIAPGTYKVAETLQPGWFQSEPTGPVDPVLNTKTYQIITAGGDGPFQDLDFGNYRRGAITGQKFQDSNGNGRQDGNEIYLNNWTIQLYNQADELVATQVTHTVGAVGGIQTIGYYEFNNLDPGDYRVVEVLQPGWVQTASPSPIDLSSNETAAHNDFGNKPSGEIHGHKWEDTNGDGKHQENEPGLAGVTIYIDTNNNDQLDPGEPFTITSGDNPEFPGDETGEYSFTGLMPGAYTIREIVPTGYVQTMPQQENREFVVNLTAAGMTFTGADFGNAPRPSSICGAKFLDKNKDGKRQSNEPLLPGWVIYLDLNNNGTRDPGEPLTTTSTDGQYCFDGLRAGEYHVYEQLKNGWSQTAPGNDVVYYKIVLTDSTVAKNVDFGNVPGTFSGTNGRDNITITRGPAGTLDIYDRNNPSQVPVFSHAFTTEPFTIDLKGGNDSIWIDLSSGNPLFPGLTINGHTGNDFVKVILPAVQNSLLIGPNDLVLNGILIGLSNFNQMEVIGGSADDMLTINGAVPFSPIFRGGGGQNQLILNDSHYDFPAEFLTDGINLNVEVHNDGELFFHGDQSLNSLIAHEAAHVVQQSHGVALRLNQLDIGPNATVDLDQSDLILQATTATRQAMYNYLFAQIARARNTGQFPATRWMGPGLTSELAHQYPNGITTLGLYQHNQTDLEFLHGFPLDDNSLIVRFTYVGDVNGDGTMNADDYAQIDAGFATHALGYANGDLDYRGGPPNSDDYFGADHAFFNQGPPINPPPPQAPALTPTAGGEIHGNKFWDINADGVRQTTEVGISGVTIYLDKNNNGVFEPAIDIGTTTLTDDPATPGVNEAGNYAFLSLAPGTYIVREVVPAGFIQTAPTAGFYTVTIDINIVNNLNFGNRPSQPGTGEIHGNKFSDTDGDGKRENGEPGLSGVVIYLDRDNSGTLSSGDISTVTQNDNPNTPTIDETGNYDFYGLPPATYIIREVVPSGYTQTAPANGSYLVEIGQGGVATGRDFGNRPNRGTISGTKFRDLDGDGKRDPNEGGIGGVTIYIDLNGNGQPDAGEPTTTTAPDGTWSFTNVPTGTYTIAEVVPPGYAQTAPVGGTFTLTFNGQTTSGLDFGNRRGEITGTKFEDRDGDGKRGANEPALPGVTIYLDLNRNGRLDENEPAMLTMNDDTGTPEIETGRYFFQDLPVGAYQVREIVPAGYTVTIPIGGLGDVPQLKAGETVTINFGNKLDIGISGAKWDDLDGDGRRVQGEPGLAGVTIYLDLNQNGQLDANEPWTITAADGSYSFTNLTTGIYTVCEVIPSGYAQTFPQTNNGCHVVQVGAGVVPGRDFGNSNLPGSIHGTKWNDLNANRMRDAGEPGLAGVFIYVDLNNNGVFDTGEPSTTSLPDNPATPGINEAGIYWIYNVPPGTWPVREVVPAGFGQSYPGVALIGSDATGMLYDFNMTTGAATNPRPTIPNLVGISQGLGFTGIHGLTSTGQLVSINETTGAWVLLGAVAATLNEGDLEFDPATGDLYGLYGSGSTLYRINPITGAPTLVGALATPDPSALAFDSSGNLFVFDGTAMKIANINKANGALISAVSISGPNLGPTSGMDFDPLTGILYLATSGNIGGAVPTLYTLNPTTGALTTIGPTSGVRATNTTFVLRDRNIAYVLPGSTINGIDFGNYQAQILPDGDDKIRGGDAADTIHGDNGSGFPAPIITIGGKDTVYGDAAADEIYGQDTDDLLYGGDDNDIIFGNDGNDTMDGNAGNDTTSGGAGDDTYVFTTPATATTDTVNELFAEGSDWFDMSDVATLLDFDFNVSNATRSTNLTIVLQDGFGADGSAYMENIQGAVTQTNKLTGNSADNILVGGNLSDTVTGNLGNNQLFGSDGDDIFIPSAGTDIIVSGDIGYDRLDYSAFPLGVTINLQTHSGTHVTSFTDIELFIGSAFSDTLIGQNIANSWHITGSNAGDVNGAGVVDFTAIENLSGGSATDTFIFSDGASVSGVIDGDGAIDSLIYSAYTTAVTVDLTAGAATGAGGVQNIENVIGGSASDVITGDANANVLIGGAGNNTIGGMDGPDTLVGGAGDDSITGGNGNDLYIMTNGGGTDTIVEVVGGGTDTITFASVTTPVTVDLQNNIATGTTAGSLANIESLIGTSGPDTLIGQDIANIWNITGLNSGNINGALFFSGFEILNGGSLSDSFNLAGGSISVEADGKFGPDTLNYAAFGGPVSVNLATHVAPLVGTFANIESLVGTASNDQLIGDNIANAWHLTALNAGDINGVGILDFSSFENLTGGSLADTFVFSDAMGVSSTIDGSAGADTFDYSAYTSAVTVNLQLQTATGTGGFAAVERFLGGTLADTLTGRNIANTWHITSANTGDINGAGVLDFSSFENLTGGSLADTFIFSNAVGASGIIAGGGDTDTFDYSLSIAGVTVNLQTGAATNVGGFASIERFIATGVTDTLTAANVANIWTINGAGAGDINGAISFTAFDNLTGGSLTDSFRFATGGSITGALNGVGLANTLDYSLRSTPVTVTLQTGVATDVPIGFINIQAFVGSTASDTLIGRNVASTWHLTANNAGDIGAPGTLDFSSFENLTGGVANDGFIFGPAVVFGGAITGGAGTDTLDYGLYTTPVTADLPGNAATGTGGALTIENLIGGSADDFLIGRDSVNNSLQGGLGNDVLVGNSGIDSLVGGNGRDILIGGIGVDNLNGGLGEDILIGGTTSWDANLANLANIMTRWLAASAYGVRITDLKTSVPQLLPATTVFNDGSADVLTGGGDLDWFLTEAVDSIIDFNNPAGETNDVF